LRKLEIHSRKNNPELHKKINSAIVIIKKRPEKENRNVDCFIDGKSEN